MAAGSFLLALFLSACRSATPSAPIERLDAEIDAARSGGAVPGMAAAVARSGGLVASGIAGKRRVDRPAPIAPDDAFHVGSVGKPFTATLAGIFVAEGRLAWETRLTDVIPEWRASIRSEYLDVTLADLLSHEAGFPPFEEDSELEGLRFDGSAREQRRRFIGHVITLPPVAARGSYRYSNAGFTAAAVMIETVAGQPWEELIRTRIADPLGLETLGFGWPARHDPDQPWGHMETGDRLEPHDPRGEYQLPAILAPAGDLHMSMKDLAAFLAEHLRALRGESTMLPRHVAETMHTRRTRSGLGFGVGKVGSIEPVSTYSGSAGTFLTFIALAPRHDVAIALAANAADARTEDALKAVLKTLMARYATSPAEE